MFSSYSFKLQYGNEQYINYIKKLFNLDDTLENIRDEEHYTIPLLWSALRDVVCRFPEVDFTVEGYCVNTCNRKSIISFLIVVKDGIMQGCCSGWYYIDYRCWYKDYIDYCNKNIHNQMSQDDFNKWKGSCYVSNNGTWVKGKDLPLYYDIGSFLP